MLIPMREEMRSLNALQAEINGLYHDACVKLGISDSASYILYSLLERGEGCTPKDIYRNYGLSRQTVHSSLNNLVRQGIVEMRQGKGRERYIFITQKGYKLLEARVMPLIALENSVLNGWTARDREELLRLMRKFRDDFRKGHATIALPDSSDCP